MNTNEVWKDIKGYEGTYQVSSLGRIKRLSPGRKYSHQVLLKFETAHGHFRVRLSKNGKGKKYFVHRLVAETFTPNILLKRNKVNHINHIKTDNRIENLEWVSSYENRLAYYIHRLKSLGYKINKPDGSPA